MVDPSPSRRIKRCRKNSWQSSRPGTPRGAHTPVPPLLRLDAASGEAAARHARSHSHARAGTGRARRAEGAAASAAAVHRRLASGEGGGGPRGAASRQTERPPSLTRPSLRRRLLRPTPPDGPRVGLAHATPSANAEHSNVERGRASVARAVHALRGRRAAAQRAAAAAKAAEKAAEAAARRQQPGKRKQPAAPLQPLTAGQANTSAAGRRKCCSVCRTPCHDARTCPKKR